MAEPSRVEWVWWDPSRSARVARAMLEPLAAVFSVVVRTRNWMYDRKLLAVRAPRIPVLSVGNITVGGTGKTPISSWLATQLAARGASPVIVLRGYGDDEPLVHARL
ncbi:MAG TPA: tetraacyldisaccharide 4'-kinase, partial [Gemmatimonadaceae bacterium]